MARSQPFQGISPRQPVFNPLSNFSHNPTPFNQRNFFHAPFEALTDPTRRALLFPMLSIFVMHHRLKMQFYHYKTTF
jgi:hypothetical protein